MSAEQPMTSAEIVQAVTATNQRLVAELTRLREARQLLAWAFDRLDGYCDKHVWSDIRDFLGDDRPQPDLNKDVFRELAETRAELARYREALDKVRDLAQRIERLNTGSRVEKLILKELEAALSSTTTPPEDLQP